jgi:hypothetical protein
MSATTGWLTTPVPQLIKDLIAKFMDIGDTKSKEAGQRLGYEVFVSNRKSL